MAGPGPRCVRHACGGRAGVRRRGAGWGSPLWNRSNNLLWALCPLNATVQSPEPHCATFPAGHHGCMRSVLGGGAKLTPPIPFHRISDLALVCCEAPHEPRWHRIT